MLYIFFVLFSLLLFLFLYWRWVKLYDSRVNVGLSCNVSDAQMIVLRRWSAAKKRAKTRELWIRGKYAEVRLCLFYTLVQIEWPTAFKQVHLVC